LPTITSFIFFIVYSPNTRNAPKALAMTVPSAPANAPASRRIRGP
jgi:hypothetical protein